jgi:hypothetical protein
LGGGARAAAVRKKGKASAAHPGAQDDLAPRLRQLLGNGPTEALVAAWRGTRRCQAGAREEFFVGDADSRVRLQTRRKGEKRATAAGNDRGGAFARAWSSATPAMKARLPA